MKSTVKRTTELFLSSLVRLPLSLPLHSPGRAPGCPSSHGVCTQFPKESKRLLNAQQWETKSTWKWTRAVTRNWAWNLTALIYYNSSQRITGSFRLEKSSRIIQSSCNLVSEQSRGFKYRNTELLSSERGKTWHQGDESVRAWGCLGQFVPFKFVFIFQ